MGKRLSSPGRIVLALFFLICILPAGFAGTPTRAVAATQTAKLDVSLKVGDASITAGDTIAITGTGYLAQEPVDLQLLTTGVLTGAVHLANVNADAQGSFTAPKVTIPDTTPTGAYRIRAIGLRSSRSAHVDVKVAAPKTTITVSPATIAPNDTIKVSGSKFASKEKVSILLSTSNGTASLPLGTAQADESGSFSDVSLHVPFGVPSGKLVVVAIGQSSNRQATLAVTVNAAAATLKLSAASTLPGEALDVSGTHFQPGETVNVDIVALSSSARLGTAQVDQSGNFSLTKVAVPANTPEGSVSVVATGASSKLSATAALKIGSRPVTLTLAQTSAKAGESLNVGGKGFIPGETVTLILSGGKLSAVTLATIVVGTDGSFSQNGVIVPSFVPAGTYALVASGQASGRSARGQLTIQAPPAARPLISIIDASHLQGKPFNLSPGGLVQIAGSNFPSGAPITFQLVSGSTTIKLATVAANGNGAVGPIGLTIPATTVAGSYTLQAQVGGKTVASVDTHIAFLTPHINVSTGTLTPGATVTVRGSGYAAGEQIVLALNGAALVTRPTTVLVNSGGYFTLSFVVPETVTNGANTLTAVGAASRATVTLTVQAHLGVATRWYFPNGDTTPGHETTITMLNTNDVVANVTMHFLYQAGPEQRYTQVVPAHSVATVALSIAAGAGRHVSTILEADRQISAASTLLFGNDDFESTPGASGPSRLWYLAEGYTNGSFREYLEVMNPSTTFATIDVRFLPFNDRPAREVRFVMQPRSNIQIDAGQYMPGQSISTIVTADHSVVVERTMRFGANGRGVHDKVGISTASTVWSFAQGPSASNRQTFFTILNPNQASPAAVTATFFDQTGKPVGAKTIVVNPLRRGNIKLNDVLPTAEVATVLTSNVPVVVERPLYQSSPNLGSAPSGSVIFGRNSGGFSWAFPTGSTANGDHTSLYLFNPGVKAAAVKLSFYTPTGGVVSQTRTLAPNSDTVIDVNGVDGVAAGPIGITLKSTNGQAFIAEQEVLNTTTQRASSTQGIAQ